MGNQDDFLDSVLDHILGFFDNIRNRSGLLFPPDSWDDTKGAAIVASLGDFEIFEFLLDVRIDSRSRRKFKISKSFTIISFQNVFQIHFVQISS